MDKALGDKIPEFNKKQRGGRRRRPVRHVVARPRRSSHQVRNAGHRPRRGRHHRRHGAPARMCAARRNMSSRGRARSSSALVHRMAVHLAAFPHHALRTAGRLRDRRLDRLHPRRRHHPVSLRREGRDALHPASGHDADAGAGAAAHPADSASAASRASSRWRWPRVRW